MNNREQIEQSIISASAYNGNDTEGLLKEVEDVYKKAQVKRDAVIKVGQLYENIRECGK